MKTVIKCSQGCTETRRGSLIEEKIIDGIKYAIVIWEDSKKPELVERQSIVELRDCPVPQSHDSLYSNLRREFPGSYYTGYMCPSCKGTLAIVRMSLYGDDVNSKPWGNQ